MKKIKLITSLSMLGIIGTTVPVVATSCDNEDSSKGTKKTVSLNKNNASTYLHIDVTWGAPTVYKITSATPGGIFTNLVITDDLGGRHDVPLDGNATFSTSTPSNLQDVSGTVTYWA